MNTPAAPPSPDLVPLGAAPRPATSAELEERVREFILADVPDDPTMKVTGIDGIRVTARLTGADVDSLVVDATGCTIDFTDHAPGPAPDDREPSAEDPAPTFSPASTEPATLTHGVLRAAPLRIQGVAVNAEVTAGHVPFEWQESADGQLAVALRDPGRRRLFGRRPTPTIRLRAGFDVAQAVAAVAKLIRADAKRTRSRWTIDQEQVGLRQLGPRRVQVSARARLRWLLFRPTFRFRVVVDIDRHWVLRLRRPSVSSSNLLLKLPLLLVSHTALRVAIREPIPLAEDLQPYTIRDLRIRAGRRLDVTLELGL